MPVPSFLQSVRQRKLVQWALTYLAGAFVVFQVVEVIAEPWGIAAAWQRIIHVLLLVGLLITLVLSWYHGELGQQRIPSAELFLIAALLAAGGGVVALLPDGGRPSGADELVPSADEGLPAIAVLPLATLSAEPSSQYLADAMTEALITELSKFEGLRVRSRGSAMRYGDQERSPSDIGRELMVDVILRGSTFIVGDSIRIASQLVDARDDRTLWAEQYDGAIGEVFTLSSEVARHIATRVSLRLTPQDEARLSTTRVVDPEAFRLYAQGLQIERQEGAQNYVRAAALYQEAADVDPSFGLAHAQRAFCLSILIGLYGYPREELEGPMRRALRSALEISPGLSEAHVAQGLIHEFVDLDWRGAQQAFLEAIRFNPGAIQPRIEYGLLLNRWTHDREATIAELRRALDLDPVSLEANGAITEILNHYREYDESITRLERVLAIEPNQFIAHGRLGVAYLFTERPEQALQQFQKALALERGANDLSGMGAALVALGREGEARVILEELVRDWTRAHLSRARLQAALGEFDSALGSLERYVETSRGPFVLAFAEPFFDPVRSHPRFEILAARYGAGGE